MIGTIHIGHCSCHFQQKLGGLVGLLGGPLLPYNFLYVNMRFPTTSARPMGNVRIAVPVVRTFLPCHDSLQNDASARMFSIYATEGRHLVSVSNNFDRGGDGGSSRAVLQV